MWLVTNLQKYNFFQERQNFFFVSLGKNVSLHRELENI